MNRTGLLWLFLLLATNAAWLTVWLGREEGTILFDEDTAALERQVEELQEEVEGLRSAEPVLLGGEAARGGREASSGVGAPVLGEGPAAHAGEGEVASAAALAARKAAAEEATAKDAATAKAYAAARAKASAMLKKVMQVQDPALRQEGIGEIAAALEGDDPYLVEYVLSVLHSVRDVEFDRGPFLGIVQQHLDSENGGIRRSALYALCAVDPAGVDVRELLESARDPDPRVRGHTSRLLALNGGKKFEGEAATVVLGLLSDENANVRKGTLRGLSGAEFPPEVERRLIEMAADPAYRGDAVHFGLSQVKDKSQPVVEALLGHLSDENGKVRARAHWGLQRGVAEEKQLFVAQQYAGRLAKFVTPRAHTEALKLIVRYGDGSVAPELERFAQNDMLDPKVRELALKAAEYLTTKKPN